jgi:hypothetical protein
MARRNGFGQLLIELLGETAVTGPISARFGNNSAFLVVSLNDEVEPINNLSRQTKKNEVS